MSSLRRVMHTEEQLDQLQPDLEKLEQSLAHVDQINRWLGGDRSVLAALAATDAAGGLDLLDVGTGSAALPRRIVDWARRRQQPIRIHATDLHPQTLALARNACRDYPEIVVQEADALQLPYADRSFTHAMMTLALHHFEGEEETIVLKELARVSRRAIIISELERCWPNYIGARLLAITWWRRNRITRHDGPLSVLRAFTPAELANAARTAGLEPDVQRAFFYRLVMVAPSLQRRAASATV